MEKKTGLTHPVPQWKCVDDQPNNNRRLHYSRFALSPLLVDQAMTIGVAMRRALLSEVEGVSIISANIIGATHEYSTLDGVRESVDEILLNLKQIILQVADDSSKASFPFDSCEQKEYYASIFAQGPGFVTAEHIKFSSPVLAVDPDQPIATLLNETQLCIELIIQHGGTKQFNPRKKNYPGFFIDATFTPVQKANFSIHSVGDPKGLQQLLLLEVWTNKTVTPAEALYQAHSSILTLFDQISPPNPFKNLETSASHISFLPSFSNFREKGAQLQGSTKNIEEKSLLQLNNHNLVDQIMNSTPKIPNEDSWDKSWDLGEESSLETKNNFLQSKDSSSNLAKEFAGSYVRLKSFANVAPSSDKNNTDGFNNESLSIDELELSSRIANCLKKANIHTIADLSNSTEEDLLKIKNFGRKSIDQVNFVLRKRFNRELLPNK